MNTDRQYPRHRPLRLPDYDYAQPGGYFVTVATNMRMPTLACARGGGLELSAAGVIVSTTWLSLPDRFDGLTVDEFVVMPDHFHGIVFLSGVGAGAMNRAPTNAVGQTKVSAPTLSEIVRTFAYLERGNEPVALPWE